MKNTLEIKIGDKKIVAEVSSWQDGMPDELYVYIRNKDGCISQDICMVRQHYHYNPKLQDFEISEGMIDCKVWADSDSEDITNEFVIGIYDEEEEE